MDYLKSQIERIQQQLSGLNATQKMLTAALVAIMVLTLLYWGKYAGQADMESLLSQPLADEDLHRIAGQLDSQGIAHRETADRRILVPADRKISIIASLGFSDMLPRNTSNGFDEIIKQMTPWDGQDRQNKMFNRGKEITLAEVIRHFPNVGDATVAIDAHTERVIGGNIEPTAIVSISMRNGSKPDKALVNAAANVLAGAQSGLAMKNIKVVVDGVPQHVKDDADDGAVAEGVYEIRDREEKRLTEKLAHQLGEIRGVMVAVTVEVNNSTKLEKKRTIDKVDVKELRTQSNSREHAGSTPAPVDPAAGSNVAVSIAGAASSPADTQNETDDKVDNAHYPSVTETELKTPSGEAVTVGASVRVPRSHFVRIAKGKGPAEPDEAAVQKEMDEELIRIRSVVVHCLHVKVAADVAVDPYYDEAPAAPEVPVTAGVSAVSLAVGGHVKEIALGALALVSLFLVSTIVKKGMPIPTVSLPEPRSATLVLAGGEAIAGEVGEGNSMLDGMELDDESVRAEQMRTQVSTLVDENPDAAAALVKRWLNRA